MRARFSRSRRTAELVRGFHRRLDLGGGVGEDLGPWAGRRALGISRVGEQACGSPQKSLPGPGLLVLQGRDDRGEIPFALGQGPALGRDVAVVEAVEVDPALGEELEEHRDPPPGVVERVAAVVPRHLGGAHPEGVGERVPHGVPVGAREPKVLAHRLALDEGIGVVVAKGQRMAGVRPLESDGGHFGKRGV
jgi:hypothetical protein